MSKALVVNLFAGPGAGKSTTAAKIFASLKMDGVNAELAHEWAKEAAWEDRVAPLRYQPYVFGKQSYRVHRLLEEVEVIVTDSPILLSLIYGKGTNLPAFEQLLWETHESWNTLNVFISRGERPYNPKGRFQTEAEANGLDTAIRALLEDGGMDFMEAETGNDADFENIIDTIWSRIGRNRYERV